MTSLAGSSQLDEKCIHSSAGGVPDVHNSFLGLNEAVTVEQRGNVHIMGDVNEGLTVGR